MNTVVYIDLEGDVTGLSDSFLDKLKSLGKKTVERVSNIEFNHVLQQWEARTTAGLFIGRSDERETLIALERHYLNSQIEKKFNEAV
jgi:hypothetical protein